MYNGTMVGDSAPAHVRAPFPYLVSGRKDCAEIVYIGRVHQLCVLYKSWMEYQYLYVPNLGVHRNILLKYGVLFDHLTLSLTPL